MNKKTIGWLILGLVVLGAVGFAGYHIYQENVIQSEAFEIKVREGEKVKAGKVKP